MAAATFTRVGPFEPEQSFLVAPTKTIDGYRNGATARALSPRDHGSSDVPFIRGVELVPERRSSGRGNVFDRAGRNGREDLEMVSGFRRPGRGDFTFRVESLLSSHGGDDDRGFVSHPEDLRAHVHAADVYETARSQLKLQKAFAIRP